jgi:hypothetical protein
MMKTTLRHRASLLRLVETYAAWTGLSEATISRKIIGSARLFSHMRKGERYSCTLRSYEAALHWFDRHWPAEAPWPSDIPRPSIPPTGEDAPAKTQKPPPDQPDTANRPPRPRRWFGAGWVEGGRVIPWSPVGLIRALLNRGETP